MSSLMSLKSVLYLMAYVHLTDIFVVVILVYLMFLLLFWTNIYVNEIRTYKKSSNGSKTEQ